MRSNAHSSNPVLDPVQKIELEVHEDSRGRLISVESAAEIIPFTPVRVFFIYDVPAGAERANHAVDCRLFIMALKGTARLTEFRGDERIQWDLQPVSGLLIPSLRYFVISDFQPGTVLAVFASKTYNETRYFDLAGLEEL